jgi:hypothetical protein
VPICVFSEQFTDVNIDGDVALPESRTLAYQTSGYPMSTPGRVGGYSSITTLVGTRDEITKIVEALESLFIDFRDNVTQALGGIHIP